MPQLAWPAAKRALEFWWAGRPTTGGPRKTPMEPLLRATRLFLCWAVQPAKVLFVSHPAPARPPSAHSNSARRCGSHPRSRGAAVVRFRPGAACSGPSPLARGRPEYRIKAKRVYGAIPARAGPPQAIPPRFKRGRGHPRSRGAALLQLPALLAARGPSPLARGRLGYNRFARSVGGAIPARAGPPACRH